MDKVNAEKLSQETRRELLKKKLKDRRKQISSTPIISKVSLQEDEGYPLSFTQQQLWVLDQIDGGSRHYHIPVALELRGELDVAVLQRVFDRIVQRHEVLRTCYYTGEDEQTYQMVQSVSGVPLTLMDISAVREEEQEVEISRQLGAFSTARFDLETDMMLRVALVKKASQCHILCVVLHHIAFDGWSMGILLAEVSQLYSAFVSGKADPLPALPVQYGDYAHWQRQWLQGEVLDSQLDYWAQQLAGIPGVHSLPLDRPRPQVQTFTGAEHVTQIGAPVRRAFMALCQSQDATLFMGLQGVFALLLARYSHSDDIVMGTPVANREQAQISGLLGFFVNTLVLRNDLSGNPTFRQVLSQGRAMLLDAYAHQQVPFEKIVERLQPQRSLSHSPLFQVMFSLESVQSGPEPALPGLSLSPLAAGESVAKFDISLSVTDTGEGLILDWNYNTDLFDGARIAQLAGHFSTLLEAVVSQPDNSCMRLPFLDDTDCQRLISLGSDSMDMPPVNVGIHELIALQAEDTPQATAVIFGQECLSYAELDAQANALGAMLMDQGVVPGDVVGLYLPRGISLLVGFYAVWKVGGIALPMDTQYPVNRLEHMLSDAQTVLLLTDGDVSFPGATTARQISLNHKNKTLPSVSIPSVENIAQQTAYLIYTSGSTGQPKGVAVSQGAIASHILGVTEHYDFSQDDVFWQMASFSFDTALEQTLAGLIVGATVVIHSEDMLVPAEWLSLMSTLNVTATDLPVAYFAQLLAETGAEDWAGLALRTLVVGGEALPRSAIENWFAHGPHQSCRLINAYGPTEAVITATCRIVEPADIQQVRIGRALSGRRLLVLDEYQQLVPLGSLGELYIGGILAQGYWRNSEMTAQKFIETPYCPGEKLYRSGDIVRWLADGELVFEGRADQQIKRRGFRIEPGEIEQKLAMQDGVISTQVLLTEDQQLVAYAQMHPNTDTNVSSINARLKRSLPEYMMPDAIVLLETWPLMPNGKVDIKALPQPDRSQLQAEYQAPQTHTEQILADIWQQLLEVGQVGLADNFFTLGGHSLLATRLVAKVNQVFAIEMPLRDVFQAPELGDMAERVDSHIHEGVLRIPPLVPVTQTGDRLASFTQQQLWVLDQIDGGSRHYHIPVALELRGELDVAVLQRVFDRIVQRHEVLRTCYYTGEDEQTYQMVQSVSGVPLTLMDISAVREEEQEVEISRQLGAFSTARFDLETDMMLRVALVKKASQCHILCVVLHHIAFDGWSMGILLAEVSQLYSAFVSGKADPLPALPVQYGDYAHWQRQWLQGEVLDSQLDYWAQQLAGIPGVHSLPLDRPRPQVQTFTGAEHVTQIGAPVRRAFMALCQSQDATLFMGLQGVFALLLARYSHSDDIVMGTPVANREQAQISGLLGFFVNTLVLRNDLSGNPTFRQVLSQGRAMLLDAYAHQQVPFEKIVERLQPQRSLSHSPLFQVMFSLESVQSGPEPALPGLSLSPLAAGESVAKFDISLSVTDTGEGLILDWNYNTDLFDGARIAQLAGHFSTLLEAVVSQPDNSCMRLPFLDDTDCQRLISLGSDSMDMPPVNVGIHELIALQAEDTPQATAVIFGQECLSYAELDAQANALGAMLMDQGVVPGDVVGLYLPRGISLLVGFYAVWKVGGIALPMDTQYPVNRLEHMLSDAQTVLLLTDGDVSFPGATTARQISLNHKNKTLPSVSIPSVENIAQQTAYLIYTSGSTGQPKGVAVSQGAIASHILGVTEHYDFSQDDVFWQMASFSFDTALEQTLAGLIVGATVVIHSEDMLVPAEWLSLMSTLNVTATDLPVAYFAQLLAETGAEDWAGLALRTLVVGGEALPRSAIENWFAHGPHQSCRLINAYGPTEAVITATCRIVEPADIQQVRIGRALSGRRLLVLDEYQQLVPLGSLGELYIGGILAQGYWRNSEMTAQKFIETPYCPGEKLYRSGDIVRWLADGELVFEGRADQQIKRRGFRIEPGEIEQKLAMQDGVISTQVLLTEDQQLVAYAQMHPNTDTNVSSINARLKRSLPEYMMPDAIVLLETWPLMPNGKVDIKALPQPDRSQLQAEYQAPQTHTEQILADIWQQLLEVGQVGLADNFFTLGGYSLLALRMIVRIKKATEKRLTLAQVFQYPVLRELALFLDSEQNQHKVVSICTQLNVGDRQSLPLFMIHPVGGDVYGYHELVQQLPESLPIYGLSRPELLVPRRNIEVLSIETLASLYIEEIKKVQKTGPYQVLGWSLGGVIALEIAQQLHTENEEVAYLGLIDSAWHTTQLNATSGSPVEALLRDYNKSLSDYLQEIIQRPQWLQQFDSQQQIAELSLATGVSQQRMREIVLAGIVALERYQGNPKHAIANTQYFSARYSVSEQKNACIKALRLQGGGAFMTYQFDADHYSIMKADAVKKLSHLLINKLTNRREVEHVGNREFE